MSALVLAGRRDPNDALARAANAPHRALLDICGTPMLTRVLQTLRASPRIDGIAVSIDQPALLAADPTLSSMCEAEEIRVLTSESSPSRSVLAGLRAVDFERGALITTADHALLNDEILDAFFEAANASDGDLVVALVRSETILKRFPAAKRTYLRFRDGHFSGANLFLVRSEAALHAIEFWKRAEQHRKQPWRIVREFGLGALVAFALGRLDLDAAFARASQVVGARVTPVELPMAEAAVDVDKLSDLELVRDLLSQSPSAAS